MRLQLTFMLLLIVAASAVSIVWQDLSAARGGEILPRILVLGAFLVALASTLLLARIILRTPRKSRTGSVDMLRLLLAVLILVLVATPLAARAHGEAVVTVVGDVRAEHDQT